MNPSSIKTALSALVRGRDSDTLDQRNARNLILSSAWLGFIDGGIATYLSVWMARMGATPTTLGILSSGPQLVNMFAQLPAGAFAERQKDLVRLANRSALITRSGFVLMAMLPFFFTAPDILWIAIALWTIITIPSSLYYPTFMSVIQRAIPPQMRPRVNANRWAIYSLVGAIAIPVIGFMIDHLTFPIGFQLAFVISCVGALPNIYFFSKVKIAPFEAIRSHDDTPRPLLRRLRDFVTPFFECKPFMRFNVATAAFRICLTMPAGLFSIYWVDNLHASNTIIGMRGMIAYAALVVGYPFWGRVTNRIGHRTLLFFSALIGLYPILTGLSPSAEWLLPTAVVWGVFVAAIDIGFVDMLLISCPQGKHPTFTAAANVLASMQNFAGPLIGAALAHYIGVAEALIVAGVLQIASGAFFILLPSRAQEDADHARTQPAQPGAAG
jgi:MFS family permease